MHGGLVIIIANINNKETFHLKVTFANHIMNMLLF